MNTPQPQSALREIRHHLGRAATVIALAAVTVVLVLAGPFGPLDNLGPAARVGYWGAVVVATCAAGTAVDVLLRPRLLDRLPPDKRGRLVAPSVDDHYVRVRTTRGEDMLLMRLGDAIRVTAPTPGLRVHRSHWVARDAVQTVRREGDRAVSKMTVGGDNPASRSHIPALREAGLLPR